MKPDRLKLLLTAAAFVIPLIMFLITAPVEIQLDDAAELAYTAEVWGIPHPPGFPAWVFLAHCWLKLTAFLFHPLFGLHLFSCILSSLAIGFLFLNLAQLLPSLFKDRPDSPSFLLAAFFSSLAAATGMTLWQWSHTVEIYPLQLFCLSLLFYFLVKFYFFRKNKFVIAAGICLGMALANHHLTMLFFLPFSFFLFLPAEKKKKTSYLVFKDKQLGLFLLIGFLTASLFYLLMMIRAQEKFPFEFGNPSNLSRLTHHLKGGFFAENIGKEKIDTTKRSTFFYSIIFKHFLFFFMYLFLGSLHLFKTKQRKWLFLCLGYLLAIFIYQIQNDQIANTDTYLIFPLFISSVLVAAGILVYSSKIMRLVLPLLFLIAQVIINYPVCNRAHYNPADDLMKILDHSAPQNSILLLTNWDLRIIYHYYLFKKNFRPDLTVLRSDIKDTNCDNISQLYPAFLKAIEPEFNSYLKSIAAVNKDYIYTDYFTIANKQQNDSYQAMLNKIIHLAAESNRKLLFDRATVGFLLRAGFIDPQHIFPHGLFFCYQKAVNEPLLELNGTWLSQPFFIHDLCAANILMDLYQIPEQVSAYYQQFNQPEKAARLSQTFAFIRKIMLGYKKNKPYSLSYVK